MINGETTFIYVLKCPKTDVVRYVGKANKPKERYSAHMFSGNRTQSSYKRNWIDSLKREGLKPVLEVIKEVPIKEWKRWEKYYVSYYRDKGCRLTNITDGGDGLGYGNQTSFKKGQKSPTKGTGNKKPCIVCGKLFRLPPSADKSGKYKCCSKECRREHVIKNPNKGMFKKGMVPWNKGVTGYSTSKKGQTVPDNVRKKISDTLKSRNRKG